MSKTSSKKRKQTTTAGSKMRRKTGPKSRKESKAVQARKARASIAEQDKSWNPEKPDQFDWEILYIREAFKDRDEEWNYYIKWAGWEDLETWRWQRESLLEGSEDIVKAFWEHIRTRERKRYLSIAAFKRTFMIGKIIVASAAWVREQKNEYRMLHKDEDLPGALNPRQISPGPWEELEPSDDPIQFQWAVGHQALQQSGAEADMTIDSGSDSDSEAEPLPSTTPGSTSASNFSPASTPTDIDSDQDDLVPDDDVALVFDNDEDEDEEVIVDKGAGTRPDTLSSPVRLAQPLSSQPVIHRSCAGSAAIPVLTSTHHPRFPKLIEGPDPSSTSVLTPSQYRLDISSKSKPLETLSFVRNTRHGRPEGMFLENIIDKPTPSQGEAESVKSMPLVAATVTADSRARQSASHSWATNMENNHAHQATIFDDYDFVPVAIEEKDWDAFDDPSPTVAAPSNSLPGWSATATSSASVWGDGLAENATDSSSSRRVSDKASAPVREDTITSAPGAAGGWNVLTVDTTVTAGWGNVPSQSTQANSGCGNEPVASAQQGSSQHADLREETATVGVPTDHTSFASAGGGFGSSLGSGGGVTFGWAAAPTSPVGWNDDLSVKARSEATTRLTNVDQVDTYPSSSSRSRSLPDYSATSCTIASDENTAAAPVAMGWGNGHATTTTTGSWTMPADVGVSNVLNKQSQGSRWPTGRGYNVQTHTPRRDYPQSKVPRHTDNGWRGHGRSSFLSSQQENFRSFRPTPTGVWFGGERSEQAHDPRSPLVPSSEPEAASPDETEISAFIADDAPRLAAVMKQMAEFAIAPTRSSHRTALSLSVCPASPEAEEGEIVDEPTQLEATQETAAPTEIEASPTSVLAGVHMPMLAGPREVSMDMDSEDEVDAELDLDDDFVEALPDRI